MIQAMVAAGEISDPEGPRGRLLNAAARLFQQQGFARTTVRDIAGEVGILSGSIFHHVKSKEDLLCEAMLEVTRVARTRMAAAVAEQQGARDRLRACIQCELEAIHGFAVPGFPILVSEWRSLSAANQKRVLAEREQYEAIWLEVLAERPENTGVSDPHLARKLLLGALSHTHNWFKPRGRGLSLDRLAAEALLTVWPQSSPTTK
ncbi:TetR/AcrR family transcriptional regulator [Microbulbifer sp. SA54]|uniref:TetR/AcrR family transcriptional regulator n=1 Tax=Microbulbifer sp. SA54 TaxID=3401577 RepID=UPI003AACC3AA